MSPTDPPNRPTDPSGVKNMTNIRKVRSTTLAVSLVAFGASCTGDDADGARPTVQPTDAAPPGTAPPETAPPETAPPETASPELVEPPATATAAESTTQPSGDTIVVPFHTVDAGFPAGWTCDDAIPGFDVAFTNESDERTIVEARFANSSRVASEDTNAACAIELFEGEPALFLTAQLVVPAAESYPLIETRYPYAGGAGNDRYDTAFEMVTAEEAQAGLYLADVALDPLEAAELAFPVVE
ncbi:MAG: hypothetical protein WA964_13045 [Ilumatobacter sp.]|uniref:hypothetical protein n=1 Tax=Ilumatobacter sp. TaxID=1967498 RepID=UPI003C7421AB